MFADRETAAPDNSPEPGRQCLHDNFGQGPWRRREGFIALLEWITDSKAARILAGRLRNDHT